MYQVQSLLSQSFVVPNFDVAARPAETRELSLSYLKTVSDCIFTLVPNLLLKHDIRGTQLLNIVLFTSKVSSSFVGWVANRISVKTPLVVYYYMVFVTFRFFPRHCTVVVPT